MPSSAPRRRFALVAVLCLLCAGVIVVSIAAAGSAAVIDATIYNVTLFALVLAVVASAVALLSSAR
ncbi:MAG TPA: hypothetical protein VFU63_00200 [Ktedonobacterales bacterium]|nr:hypothetical protein [Ktedonobacterales bacterium]